MQKKKVTKNIHNESFELPCNNRELEDFIKNHKTHLTEKTISSIEYAVTNKLPFIEVFKFQKSDFVITISEDCFLSNVDHIYKFYLDSEKYELCPRVVKLLSVLKNLKPNEKEIETTGN